MLCAFGLFGDRSARPANTHTRPTGSRSRHRAPGRCAATPSPQRAGPAGNRDGCAPRARRHQHCPAPPRFAPACSSHAPFRTALHRPRTRPVHADSSKKIGYSLFVRCLRRKRHGRAASLSRRPTAPFTADGCAHTRHGRTGGYRTSVPSSGLESRERRAPAGRPQGRSEPWQGVRGRLAATRLVRQRATTWGEPDSCTEN